MESNRGTVAVIATPLIGLSVLDVLVLEFSHFGLFSGLHLVFLTLYVHLFFALITATTVMAAAQLGKRGPVDCLAALVLAHIAVTRFRGHGCGNL